MTGVKTRDEYTWDDAAKDLAMTTHLTLKEALDLTWPLRQTSLHPYDALPILERLVGSYSNPSMSGFHLYALLTGETWRG